SSPIQASANLTCGNTQGPDLFAHNLQWHNPITQPVIGPFHKVQHSTGSVSHSQPMLPLLGIDWLLDFSK
ncbi:hypothetical protein KUCAC02_014401, partial [Chaenocephalus aceratus]